MSSGNAKAVHGSFQGATAADVDVANVGFRPTRVYLLNETGLAEAWWQKGMPEGTMLKRVTAGTLSLVAAPNGITPLAGGFRLGQDADMNVVNEIVRYECTD